MFQFAKENVGMEHYGCLENESLQLLSLRGNSNSQNAKHRDVRIVKGRILNIIGGFF